MDASDEHWLRHTFRLAEQALDDGDQPFAAAVVSAEGHLLFEASNTRGRTGDCTRHAETIVAGLASIHHTREQLATATMYSSTEPCLMCSGALAWSGIGRLVFGVSQARAMAEFVYPEPPRFAVPTDCRALLSHVRPAIVIDGPWLADEALVAHRRQYERDVLR